MVQPSNHRRLIKAAVGFAGLVAFGWGLAASTAPLGAVEPPIITKVEERWEMVVATANPTNGGPQLNTVMSPYPHVNDYYGLFTINYIDLPFYANGGMQAQLWKDKIPLHNDPHREGIPLQNDNETITWTQTLALGGGWLSFHIQNGTSTTWGTFGELDYCHALYPAADLPNLNGYTPNVSVEYARRWGLERDRITSLRITRIRKWDGATLVFDDSTAIPVLPN